MPLGIQLGGSDGEWVVQFRRWNVSANFIPTNASWTAKRAAVTEMAEDLVALVSASANAVGVENRPSDGQAEKVSAWLCTRRFLLLTQTPAPPSR